MFAAVARPQGRRHHVAASHPGPARTPTDTAYRLAKEYEVKAAFGIANGALADLLLVDGDPLADIASIADPEKFPHHHEGRKNPQEHAWTVQKPRRVTWQPMTARPVCRCRRPGRAIFLVSA